MTAYALTAPPTAPGSLPAPRRSALDNKPGLIGLLLCVFAVLAAPGVEVGLPPLPFSNALGAIGVLLCIKGCSRSPRRYAVIGLILVLLSALFWAALTVGRSGFAAQRAAEHGMSAASWEHNAHNCFELACAVEQIRVSTGALPATVNTSLNKDPWGRSYRYVLAPVTAKNLHGYTFMSDGRDGKPNTPDDLDLVVLHESDVMYQLPPPTPTPAPPAAKP